MAKNIVVCADGTWNRPTAHTNVIRLFNLLPGTPNAIKGTQEIGDFIYRNTPDQVAFYLEGVGARASHNDLLGGMTGTGLHAKVLDGYLLVSRAYEPGDKIFLFGFSRGAYTARSLAALIAKVGLLPKALAEAANCRFTAQQRWNYFKKLTPTPPPAGPDAADPQPIRLVGVWDTVGALGIPFFNGVQVVDDIERAVFDFADLDLSPRVAYGLHALAIDERRQDFIPSLWTARAGVTQLWFPGVHSDVGGGYPFRGVADIALRWMLDAAAKPEIGLVLEPFTGITGDAVADRHESADSPIWALRSQPRDIPPGAKFHPCVLQRFHGRPDYRPKALAQHPDFSAFYTGTPVRERIYTADPTAPTPPLHPGESLTVMILAEKWWNGSGLAVAAGDTYDIAATGTWSDASHNCNADGWDGLPWMVRFRRVPEVHWFHLCLAVSDKDDLECENANFFQGFFGKVSQIDHDSVLVPVGQSRRVTMPASGSLYFFANDAPTHYGNNLGYLMVTITRV